MAILVSQLTAKAEAILNHAATDGIYVCTKNQKSKLKSLSHLEKSILFDAMTMIVNFPAKGNKKNLLDLRETLTWFLVYADLGSTANYKSAIVDLYSLMKVTYTGIIAQ